MSEPAGLTFERVFASPSLNGPSPREARLSPDGRYLTLLRNREDDRERYDLWGYDRESGAWAMLVDSEKLGSGRELSEDEKMQRERRRVGDLKGIVSYQWTADSLGVLVPLDGDIYLVQIGVTRTMPVVGGPPAVSAPENRITRLTDSGETELNASLSSLSNYLTYVSARQLWVGAVGELPQAITPKEADTIRWGEAEFVAQEELDRHTGYWWSPDDTRIVVQRTDESPVGIVTRAAIGATGTKTFEQRYPVAGSANALVELYMMDPDGKNRVRIDLGDNPDIYVGRVDWAPDASAVYVQRLDRDQTVIDVLRVDPATGKSSVLFTEHAAAKDYWVNLSNNYKLLDDGSLLWWSERDGFGHLYRFSGGNWTQLTKGEWVVMKLVGVDQLGGRIFIRATKDSVLAPQIYSLPLAGGDPVRLTDPDYSNDASMDAKGQTLLVTRSNDDHPPQSYIADQKGTRIAWIEENALSADHPYAPFLASHRPTEYGTIAADDGTPLHYEMITPELEPGKRYPVYFYHYGGPHAQIVSKEWDGALRQAIVDKGYIWFALDNRGSANRGVAFEQPIYHAMGGVEVRDQKAGAEYLKSLPFVDPARIAIDGWSYGGYMTLKMLEADPGFYAAGIAGAPVTRWELYDTAYTERYMGMPQRDGAAYEAASAIPEATRIADPLLLMHGMADDNVVFENSTALIAELQGANIAFEMMLYPGYTHRVSGEQISPHRYNTIFRFLEAHGATPPE